jgi:hypothetical protein
VLQLAVDDWLLEELCAFDASAEDLEEVDKDPANPNNVIGFYTGRVIPKNPGGNTPSAWNREYPWAKPQVINRRARSTAARHRSAARRPARAGCAIRPRR